MSRRGRRRSKRRRGSLLVIDGHNLCYQDPELRQLLQQDSEHARRALEARIGDRAGCHLFYDGGPGGEERRQHHGKLAIHYSGKRSADDCLVEWIAYQNVEEMTVVTDDRELQMRVRSAGATLISCSDFLDSLSHSPDTQPGIDELPPSQDEIDFWKDEFGAG